MKRVRKVIKVLRDPVTKKMIGVDETVFEDGDVVAKSSTGVFYALPAVVKIAPEMRTKSAAELEADMTLDDLLSVCASPEMIREWHERHPVPPHDPDVDPDDCPDCV
jgi:hypothetical protein